MTNRYAIVENGLVTNVVIASAEIASENGWIKCPQAGPGWGYANGEFTEPSLRKPDPVLTKEELLAQLQQLQAQIQALE